MVLRGNLNRWFYTFCGFGIMSMVWMMYRINHTQNSRIDGGLRSSNVGEDIRKSRLIITKPSSSLRQSESQNQVPGEPDSKQHTQKLTIENRALIILNPSTSNAYQSIIVAMIHLRFKFRSIKYTGAGLQPLHSSTSQGLYSVIIFQDLHIYMSMNYDDRERIEAYCRQFSVGMIIFAEPQSGELYFNKTIAKLPISYSSGVDLKSIVVHRSPVADIARTNVKHNSKIIQSWYIFHPNDSSYKTISSGISVHNASHITAVLDPGEHDGIQRIFFGHRHYFWLHKILFLDALSYLTRNAMNMDKTKYIQIDIDDMFIGANGTKMKPPDVDALVKAQIIWSKYYVPGFKFFIGISGKFYKRGLLDEQAGDERIISKDTLKPYSVFIEMWKPNVTRHVNSHKSDFVDIVPMFRWFDHTYSHIQAHKFTDVNSIIKEFQKNKEFAQEHGIPIDPSYAVAPHHSGVYPIHEQLYEAWKSVWNISVTSTEEYPHLKMQMFRKGFIHSGVKVLPRQICGLYTKNLLYEEYPGGPARLENNILGGELFDTILYNYINVYMTHQQNYGNHRLAIYTFDNTFQLFTNSTTLRLRGAHPVELGELYFKKYPQDKDPLWLNPCSDKKHREIWNEEKSCSKLPSLLIVGPQKTGTTALYTYLKLHPNITANRDSPTSYEEPQFFGSPNYAKGIEWYMGFFQDGGFSFEKSATYFDKDAAPKQASLLVPAAKIIIMLLDPIDRALSWYYHQQAHKDKVAIENTFHDVITHTDKSNKAVQSLKAHMIKPGFYYDHIQKWRQYYSDSQILYVDGSEFKTDPISVLNTIQKFLGLDNVINYQNILKFDEKKGFYCHRKSGDKSECLGQGKGRSRDYPEVDAQSRAYLKQVFATPNAYLKDHLSKLKYPIPDWLKAG